MEHLKHGNDVMIDYYRFFKREREQREQREQREREMVPLIKKAEVSLSKFYPKFHYENITLNREWLSKAQGRTNVPYI